MEVKQIYDLVNKATAEIVGEENLLKEDLSNLVEVGTAVFNANAMDKYVGKLVNHIGKVIFVNRVYKGSVPSVLMDGWEYGSVLEKVQVDLPEATENESWELEGGTSYDPNIFYKPSVSAKFFNKRITFEVPMSFTEKQVKQSFSNAQQMNGFVSMLYNACDKTITIKLDGLIMRTINNLVAETVYADYGVEPLSSKSGVKAINVLYLYNQLKGTSLTADKALQDTEFIKYASYIIKLYGTRIGTISTLFNIEGKERFTPTDLLHLVMLADFKDSADVYLQSSTFHNELTKLPNAETVPFWQGSGKTYSLEDVSKIDVKTASGGNVEVTGLLAVMFDRDALGVCNVDRRTTTNYNPKAEFYTNWYKYDAEYFNDFQENCIVFFMA